MKDIGAIESRRKAILEEMGSMPSMKRGTINEQCFKAVRKGKKQPTLLGPYYVLSRREGSRTVSERLASGEALEKARRDVAAYHRFQALAKEFVQLTETLGERGSGSGEAGLKKKPRSPSNRMGR